MFLKREHGSNTHAESALNITHRYGEHLKSGISKNNNSVWIFKRAARQRLHETRFSLTVTFTLSGFESVDVASKNNNKERKKPFKLNEKDLRALKKFEFERSKSHEWIYVCGKVHRVKVNGLMLFKCWRWWKSNRKKKKVNIDKCRVNIWRLTWTLCWGLENVGKEVFDILVRSWKFFERKKIFIKKIFISKRFFEKFYLICWKLRTFISWNLVHQFKIFLILFKTLSWLKMLQLFSLKGFNIFIFLFYVLISIFWQKNVLELYILTKWSTRFN